MLFALVLHGSKQDGCLPMVNTTPRRKSASKPVTRTPAKKSDPPWKGGDPTRKVGLNTPLPEPLMMQLDWLVEQRIIYSKASFIREILAKACEEEISRAGRVRAAIKKIEAEDKRK